MKLQAWLEQTGTTQKELARLINRSPSAINRYIRCGRVPDDGIVVLIYYATNGAVQPNDWYDLDTITPEIEDLLNRLKGRRRLR